MKYHDSFLIFMENLHNTNTFKQLTHKNLNLKTKFQFEYKIRFKLFDKNRVSLVKYTLCSHI